VRFHIRYPLKSTVLKYTSFVYNIISDRYVTITVIVEDTINIVQ